MEEDQATEEKEVKDDDEEEEEEEEMMDGFNCVEFSTGTASKQWADAMARKGIRPESPKVIEGRSGKRSVSDLVLRAWKLLEKGELIALA